MPFEPHFECHLTNRSNQLQYHHQRGTFPYLTFSLHLTGQYPTGYKKPSTESSCNPFTLDTLPFRDGWPFSALFERVIFVEVVKLCLPTMIWQTVTSGNLNGKWLINYFSFLNAYLHISYSFFPYSFHFSRHVLLCGYLSNYLLPFPSLLFRPASIGNKRHIKLGLGQTYSIYRHHRRMSKRSLDSCITRCNGNVQTAHRIVCHSTVITWVTG